MVCFLSTIQSPVQAFLRPAVWIPGLNRLHSHREQWVCMSGTADQLTDELILAVNRVAEADPQTTYAVRKVDRDKHRVQIYNWTRAEWLDVVEIEFRDGVSGGVEAKCFSFSSGFLPTWFPLCFVFNIIFFFFPFYDNKFNKTRLESLRNAMASNCILVPGASDQPTETTPIIPKDARAPTDPKPSAVTSTEPTPTATSAESMPTASSEEPPPSEVPSAEPIPTASSEEPPPSEVPSAEPPPSEVPSAEPAAP